MKNNFSFEDYKIIGEIKNKRHILLISLFLLIVGIIILCKLVFTNQISWNVNFLVSSHKCVF